VWYIVYGRGFFEGHWAYELRVISLFILLGAYMFTILAYHDYNE
jgi:hypothetical protein